MSLDNLEKDIYRPGYENDRRLRTEFDPDDTRESSADAVRFDGSRWDGKPETPKTFLDRLESAFRKYWLAGLGVAVVLLVVVNFSLIRSVFFSHDRVGIEILGPTEVASGEVVSYRVAWRNMNTLGASDAELTVSLPDSFRLGSSEGFSVDGGVMRIRLGDLPPHGSGEYRFTGTFYGSKGELSYLHGELGFSLIGISDPFGSESRIGVTVASSPLFLDTIVPLEAASGNEVEYVVNYRNDGDIPYSNVRVVTEYPTGFRFGTAVPGQTEGDNIWRLGTVPPGVAGEIRIRGTLGGERDEAKPFRASVGVLQGDGTFAVYETKERSTRMVGSPIALRQQVNERNDLAAKPGDLLKYVVSYENRGDIGLRDAIVSVEIDPNLLNITGLSIEQGGFYDPVRRAIVWNASVMPDLSRIEPGNGGSVRFSVPLRTDLPTASEGGKHLSVKTIAKMDSPDIPFVISSNKTVASNLLEVRVGSVIEFGVVGFHTDTVIPNSGPIPPKVGQETTYMLRFRAVNYLNDLSDAFVTILLPPGVRYTGAYVPESEPIVYNERAGSLIWNIGSMFGGGRSAKELSVQVGVTPGPDKVGETLTLLEQATFEAKDTFTDEMIRASLEEKTTALREDGGLPFKGGIVVP